MIAIIVLGILTVLYIVMINKPPKMTEPQDWMYKKIQTNINTYFGKHICRQVRVEPIGFIFDDLEPHNGSFIVSAKVKVDGQNKEYTVLVEDMSDKSTLLASDTIINKIKEDITALQLTGC
jgi:hypothetical protein